MPGRLGYAKKAIHKQVLRAVSHASGVKFASTECPGPWLQAYRPSAVLSKIFETQTDWSWDVLDAIDSLGANDTERASAVTRSVTRGASVVHTLLDFCRVLGYKDQWQEADLKSFILYYTGLDLLGSLIVNLKYHLLWLSNRARGAEPPERKDTVRSIDGWLLDYRFLRYLKRRSLRQDWVGETLLLGIKRGLPSMDERNVKSELLALVKDLSTPSESTPKFLLQEVRRTAQEIWGENLQPVVTNEFQFSDRSGYEKVSAIKKGGIRGVVWRWAIAEGCAYNETQLEKMQWGPHCGLCCDYAGLIELTYTHVWQALYNRWQLADTFARGTPERFERTKCRVAVIYEPLKIRPITAGESHRYALGKPFQQTLWEALQEFPIFQLTGSTVSAAAVTRQMSIAYPDEVSYRHQAGGRLHRGYFRSGDYRGATNYIHADCTTEVLDAVVRQEDYRRLCRDLVESHEVEYALPESTQGKKRKRLATFTQRSGQLMGSMISFPILCCVNAAVLRCALEISHGRKYNLNQLPAMINGDDILFRGSWEDDQLWQALCPKVGFHESVGKSYISKDWVQINSRTFDMSLGLVPGMAIATKQRGFVNFGVIEGYSKGVDPQDEPDFETLSIRLSSFWKEFEHLPSGGIGRRVRELALERLTERFRRAKAEGYIPFVPSFSNPVWAGGFGLFDAPFDVQAANEAMEYRFRKPTVQMYLYRPEDKENVVEGYWDKGYWKPLESEEQFVDYREQQLRLKYRD